MINAITPILIVDSIEPSIPFWEERLGFQRTAEVPMGEELGFVMFSNGSATVMYQTVASALDDVPGVLANATATTQFLFMLVDDLDAVIERLDGVPVVVEDRTTFYGTREIGVREPGGHVVLFAQELGQADGDTEQ